METPLRVGIVGCGALGVVHTGRFSRIERARVVAVCDPDEEAMKRAAAAAGGTVELRTPELARLLDHRLDAVCIASPDAFHVSQALAALRAGKHVLCEKPLTPVPRELRAVIRAAQQSRLKFSMTYPRRYDGGIRAMRREILSGAWGPVESVLVYNAEDWVTPNVGTWRHDPALCPGGFFYDASGHQLDTLFWATGLHSTEVRAATDHYGTQVPLRCWGEARLSNGAPFVFNFVGTAGAWREHVAIHCRDMDFALQNGKAQWLRGGRFVAMEPDSDSGTADEAFVALVLDDDRNWAPPEELWPVLEFTRAALRSAETGRLTRVQPPPA